MQSEQKLLERIELNAEVPAGKPIIRGLRISVEQIIKDLAAGITQQQILANYPEIEQADIQACLLYASQLLEEEKVYKVA